MKVEQAEEFSTQWGVDIFVGCSNAEGTLCYERFKALLQGYYTARRMEERRNKARQP
jgi:hypothetical protein